MVSVSLISVAQELHTNRLRLCDWQVEDLPHWIAGHATEGALEVLKFSLKNLKIERIFSYTARINAPSINVMKKIGLKERPELEFEHSKISVGDNLRKHVVYST